MEIFVIMNYYCSDYYYGYNEVLHMIVETYEEAKEIVDNKLRENATLYDNNEGFIQIFKMKLGSHDRTMVYSSREKI